MQTNSFNIAVLLSGNGSNLQAILDAISAGQLRARCAGVISDNPMAQGLERAKKAGIPSGVINKNDFSDRSDFDVAMRRELDQLNPDLIVLAGFMRILGADFVNHFANKIINIHPSLLPKYRGLHTHQRAIDAGDTIHGTTVHYVTEGLDEGPIIAQQSCPILANDTATTLKARVQAIEHQLYPRVIQAFAARHANELGSIKPISNKQSKDHNPTCETEICLL